MSENAKNLSEIKESLKDIIFNLTVEFHVDSPGHTYTFIKNNQRIQISKRQDAVLGEPYTHIHFYELKDNSTLIHSVDFYDIELFECIKTRYRAQLERENRAKELKQETAEKYKKINNILAKFNKQHTK